MCTPLVVIIEDIEDFAEHRREQFESQGCTVFILRDLESATRFYESLLERSWTEPVVILFDWQLGSDKTDDLVRRAVEDREAKKHRFILVGASSHQDSPRRQRRQGLFVPEDPDEGLAQEILAYTQSYSSSHS
ncbi:MAG: hypothetical protein WEC84_03255 [Candidatus Andersenbacteria bacterium]